VQKVLVRFALLVALVVGSSYVSSRLWGGRPEGQQENRPRIIEAGMTVAQLGQRNELPPMLLQKFFNLGGPADQQRLITTFGMSDR
jgi:hypothetical protein